MEQKNAGNETRLAQRAARLAADFLRLEAAGGILLIGAALLALICANSPLEQFYEHFREMPLQIRVGSLDIAKPMLLWINDGLMAVFFLLVALEIKREAISGQLSKKGQLVLPLMCAAGGVAVPALIYTAFNRGDAALMRGWAIPTATDIAFALGVLSLLGSRVPNSMKVLLSAIAVIDDLVAILIIAIFYTNELSMLALGFAAIAVATMIVLNRCGVRAITPYLILGCVVWVCVLKSGVHATLAGVVTGLCIPHTRADSDRAASSQTPLESLEHILHPWVAYLILPLFAFVNAGLMIADFSLADLATPLSLGVLVGLVLGKPIGVVTVALLCHTTRIARLPSDLNFSALLGLGVLCGIGFTMSLFISGLAFGEVGANFDHSVLAILAASCVAAVLGYLWLFFTLPKRSA
ncbi:Na+/H+ antiporter NhaA [Lysobacter soyae]|uniref:Na(+)/H(+) antiporter NhaA n=1 Tax=Lysobacter soyae TaxID=2764185 RepID=A0ABX8WPQ1_9GAMM|nr:Na+/H+ antiporter NhaA [Lysobacter sp. CJ11]QYR52759.1 Na+/H+ antiporter NhaA [Lysobacter sp. CJ11]